jgi:hypothetical protein
MQAPGEFPTSGDLQTPPAPPQQPQATPPAAPQEPQAPPLPDGEESLKRAGHGAIIFAAGAVLAALVYFLSLPVGAYFVCAGLVLFGALKVFVNVFRWRGVEATAARPVSFGRWSTTIGIIGIGLLALAGVGYTEVERRQESAAMETWLAAFKEHDQLRVTAYGVLQQFFAREGVSQQDIDDAERIADLYDRAALALESVPRVPKGAAEHRTEITALEHNFAESFRGFATSAKGGSAAEGQRHLDRALELEGQILAAIQRYKTWEAQQTQQG